MRHDPPQDPADEGPHPPNDPGQSNRPGDYKVGRGRPPKRTRFKPGQSGNPSGRRRRKPTLAERIEQEFDAKVTVKTGSGPKRMTKRDVVISKMMGMAMGGDIRALKCLTDLMAMTGADPTAPPEQVLPADSASYLADFLARQTLGQAVEPEAPTGVDLDAPPRDADCTPDGTGHPPAMGDDDHDDAQP